MTAGIKANSDGSAAIQVGGVDAITLTSAGAATFVQPITLTTDLAVTDGGTGQSSLTANNVILGNGTSAVQFVAPGANGNILTSNGTTWTSASASSSFVTGMIIMWSGTIATIPSGWALCDGTSGTPDLRNRFVIASSVDSGGQSVTTVTGANTKTGGTKDAIVVSHSHTATVNDPGHTHTFAGAVNPGGGGNPGRVGPPTTLTTNSNTTGITVGISTQGSSGTDQNLPPYFALAYIMKL